MTAKKLSKEVEDNEVQTMPITKEYITLNIKDIIPYENNPRVNDTAVNDVVIVDHWEKFTGEKAVLLNGE